MNINCLKRQHLLAKPRQIANDGLENQDGVSNETDLHIALRAKSEHSHDPRPLPQAIHRPDSFE